MGPLSLLTCHSSHTQYTESAAGHTLRELYFNPRICLALKKTFPIHFALFKSEIPEHCFGCCRTPNNNACSLPKLTNSNTPNTVLAPSFCPSPGPRAIIEISSSSSSSSMAIRLPKPSLWGRGCCLLAPEAEKGGCSLRETGVPEQAQASVRWMGCMWCHSCFALYPSRSAQLKRQRGAAAVSVKQGAGTCATCMDCLWCSSCFALHTL